VTATLLKAALPSIPLVNQLPGIRKTGGDPSLVREVRTATVSGDRVRAYAEVCGFPVKDSAPLTYPHVLAFPLHLAVMTSPDFPFPAIGTVHVANRITCLRPIAIGETLHLEVHTEPTVPHPHGTAVDFVATATAEGELVWQSVSTYLRRGRAGEASTRAPAAPGSTTESPVVPGRITWRLAGDLGRRYAAVSGDHNPIHLYPLTAKAFGFKRQIAHGMWSLARCVAALENRLPEAVTVEVSFKKPVFLPGTVAFGQDAVHDEAESIVFALTSPSSGAPHLVGRAHRA
jgi:acyl dehydratase